MHMKPASPSTVPVFKFKFLYYAPHGVFQASLHVKRKLTLRNMKGAFIVAIRTLHISSALTFLSSCSRIT